MWRVMVWFIDGSIPSKGAFDPPCLVEEFAVKSDAVDRGQEILADGYQVKHNDVDYFFPASSILYMTLEQV